MGHQFKFKFCGYEGPQAMPASRAGKGKFSEDGTFGSGGGKMKNGASGEVVSCLIAFISKPKFFKILFNNQVRTARKTPYFTVTKINRLTLFKEIIAVYSENRTKPTNTLCGQTAELMAVTAHGAYICHYFWTVNCM
jgi:hypothetical protein